MGKDFDCINPCKETGNYECCFNCNVGMENCQSDDKCTEMSPDDCNDKEEEKNKPEAGQ